MFNIFLGEQTLSSVVRQLAIMFAYPLPEAYQYDPAYIETRLQQEDDRYLFQSVALLFYVAELWRACILSWAVQFPDMLNPQRATRQISRMYGPDISAVIEQKFLDDYFELFQKTMRWLSPFLLGMNLLGAMLDIWCLPNTWPIAWAIRTNVFLVLAVTTVLTYRFDAIYKKFYQPIQAVSILASSFGLIGIIAQSHMTEPGHSAYLAGLLMLIVLTATLSGLRANGVFWTCLFLLLGFGMAEIIDFLVAQGGIDNNKSSLRLLNDGLFVLSASLSSIVLMLFQEHSLRLRFMIRYVLLHTYSQFIRSISSNASNNLHEAVSRLQYTPRDLQTFLINTYPAAPLLFPPETTLPQLLPQSSPLVVSAADFLLSPSKSSTDCIGTDLEPIQDSGQEIPASKAHAFLASFRYVIARFKSMASHYYKALRKILLAEEAYLDFETTPNLKAVFNKDYFYASIRIIRATILLACTTYIGFGVLDWFALPETRQFSLSMRLAFVVLAFLMFLFSLGQETLSKSLFWLLSISLIYAGTTIVGMIALANPCEFGYSTYYLGLINVILYTFAFTKIRFPVALLASTITIVSYVVVALVFQKAYLTHTELALFASNFIFLMGSCLAGAIALKLREDYAHDEFFVRYLLIEKNKEILIYQERENISPQQLWIQFTEVRHSPERLKALLTLILQSDDLAT